MSGDGDGDGVNGHGVANWGSTCDGAEHWHGHAAPSPLQMLLVLLCLLLPWCTAQGARYKAQGTRPEAQGARHKPQGTGPRINENDFAHLRVKPPVPPPGSLYEGVEFFDMGPTNFGQAVVGNTGHRFLLKEGVSCSPQPLDAHTIVGTERSEARYGWTRKLFVWRFREMTVRQEHLKAPPEYHLHHDCAVNPANRTMMVLVDRPAFGVRNGTVYGIPGLMITTLTGDVLWHWDLETDAPELIPSAPGWSGIDKPLMRGRSHRDALEKFFQDRKQHPLPQHQRHDLSQRFGLISEDPWHANSVDWDMAEGVAYVHLANALGGGYIGVSVASKRVVRSSRHAALLRLVTRGARPAGHVCPLNASCSADGDEWLGSAFSHSWLKTGPDTVMLYANHARCALRVAVDWERGADENLRLVTTTCMNVSARAWGASGSAQLTPFRTVLQGDPAGMVLQELEEGTQREVYRVTCWARGKDLSQAGGQCFARAVRMYAAVVGYVETAAGVQRLREHLPPIALSGPQATVKLTVWAPFYVTSETVVHLRCSGQPALRIAVPPYWQPGVRTLPAAFFKGLAASGRTVCAVTHPYAYREVQIVFHW